MTSFKIAEENNEKSRETLRLSCIALFVMLLNSVLDLFRGLYISAGIVMAMALFISIIIFFVYNGKKKGIVGAVVCTLNPLLILASFAEGLQTGSYLFILPLLFALGFLMSSSRVNFLEVIFYFFLTVVSFCTCIIFGNTVTKWQHITNQMANNMFRYNCIIVACLCALFAYIGIFFEKRYRTQLIEAMNKAELQEKKIKGQNKNLQDIAFMNAHILRSPLTNILALTQLIDTKKITDEHNKEMIEYLQQSAQQMDDAIKEIVAMTTPTEK